MFGHYSSKCPLYKHEKQPPNEEHYVPTDHSQGWQDQCACLLRQINSSEDQDHRSQARSSVLQTMHLLHRCFN